MLARLIFVLLLAAAPALRATDQPRPAAAGSALVLVLEVDGIISPASSQFILDGLAKARGRGAALLVIELDTPGGLDTSMREIIKAILASPVPVATYVHPAGARAASAGTYILYASHVAAMSPATNLGAATPVSIGLSPGPSGKDEGTERKPGETEPDKAPQPGSTLERKAINDATAYIEGLAELRGRNVEFARRAVREAVSLSAEEALSKHVVDVVAPDLASLLKQLDGHAVRMADGERRLATGGAVVEHLRPDWRNRLLAALANPQLALVLMMIGIYGLFFEFTSPGFGVPGVAGAICLLLALYAFQLLPVNWAGVALLALGAALMLAEAFLPSFGVLGIGGIMAFVLGGVMLIDSELPALGIPLPFLAGTTLLSAALIFAIGGFAARSHRRPPVTGSAALAGAIGRVSRIDEDGSWATVAGESWKVRSAEPLAPGERIRVTGVEGLTLVVSRAPAERD